jgi:type II secretory pathway component GspD/PulD (secretin)
VPSQIGGLAGGQVGGQVGGQAGGQQGQAGGQVGGQGGGAVGTTTIQQPVFEVVNVTTTVSVPDGGTVLLGGIKRLREGRSMAGVPILNKIPYISRLFKNTGVGRETESLMLMVTPRIIIQEEEEELLGIPL